MDTLYCNKIFNILLLVTILGEFLLPWILKRFYKGYDSRLMVMSALGNPESPVRRIYNLWLIWLGVFLSFAAVVIYFDNSVTSLPLAVLISVFVIIFALGAGLLAGIFSVNEKKEIETISSKIHGIGSAIGFMIMLFFPLLCGIVGFLNGNAVEGITDIFSFILAAVFFIFFIIGDKENFKSTIFSYAGLWERLTLFFMYVPFIYRGIYYLFYN